MPCTYDPSPQEIKQAQELAKKKREDERKFYTDKIDELAVENCRLRHLVLAMGTDYKWRENFKTTEEYHDIWNAQVEHRKKDQARAIQELSPLLASDDENERKDALERINKIMRVNTDIDLIFTRLF